MSDMTRAEALRAVIAHAEGAEDAPTSETIRAAFGRRDAPHLYWNVMNNGDLNAVARFEEPIRQRGWVGPFITPAPDLVGVQVEWGRVASVDLEGPNAAAPTETRARLLAVLSVLLHEEEAAHDR